MNLKIGLSVFTFLWTFLHADTLQVFLEEMNNVTIQCPPFTSYELEMYVVFTNVENRVYSCRNDTLPCIGITLNKAEFNTSGSYFRIPFKDIQLKRRLKGVRCLFTNGQSISTYSEDVLFIAKAEGVKCLNAKVIDNNTNITVECMTSKIYPLATCTFDVPGQISYSHVNYSDTVEYYQSNCTWTSALQNFQAGNNLLNVYFYPNVTRAIHFATSLTTTFHFNVSNIFLSKECFNGPNIIDGYIRPGATAICVCYLDNIGYPPASLEWSNGSHLNEGTNLNSTATALTIEPFSQERMYTCTRSTHLLKDESSISYVVKYAKGPTACSVEFKDKTQTVWKMCTNAKINWTVICQVNQTDAIPGIKGKININSIYSNVLNSQNMSTMYQVRNEFNVTEAGTYSIGCLVQNLHFNDVYATCSYIPVLQVIAPPKTSPILQFKSTSVEYQMGLQENKVYTVECTAFGGIPSVSNITVSCGNIKELTQSGNILTSPVTFTRTMTGQNCTCTAQHITGCYENNTSTLQLNILYKSSVTSFTVLNTVIDKGNFAPMFCAADGHPAPNISISKGSEIIAYNSSGYFLFFNKSMSCKDAGNYLCQANNGIDFNYKEFKQVTVYVTCPLQFETHEILKTFSLQNGNFFFYTLTVYGYPEPDKFRILKSNTESNNVIVTKSSMEPPYVSVELKIFSLTSSDFDNYTLVIFQSGAQSLMFTFSINEALEDEMNKPTTDNVAAIVGGSIAACVLVVIIIVAVIITRKYEIICRKKQLDQSPKQVQTYSELSMSEQLQDTHPYESPFTNTNVSTSESLNTSAKYLNVKVVQDEVKQENSSPYCNTVDVKFNQPVQKTFVLIEPEKRDSPYEEIDNI